MRVLLGLAFIVALLLIVWIAVIAYRAQQRKREDKAWADAVRNARWEDYIRGNEYETKVIIRKVARLSTGEEREFEFQVVETISSDDSEWDSKYASAVVEAANRATALNIGSLS